MGPRIEVWHGGGIIGLSTLMPPEKVFISVASRSSRKKHLISPESFIIDGKVDSVKRVAGPGAFTSEEEGF